MNKLNTRNRLLGALLAVTQAVFVIAPGVAEAAGIEAAGPPVIEETQAILRKLGHYEGPVDGLSNAEFRMALRRFQVSRGLEATGEITEETHRALKEATRPPEKNTLVAVPVPETRTPAPAAVDGTTASGAPAAPTVVPPAPVAPISPTQPLSKGAIESDRALLAEEEGEEETDDGEYATGRVLKIFFAGTPFEQASLDEQQSLLSQAASVLRRHGLLTVEDAGKPEAVEEALIRYQSSEGIALTGRLDGNTAASMRLMPLEHFAPGRTEGENPPGVPGVYRGRIPRSTPPTDAVRGIWVR